MTVAMMMSKPSEARRNLNYTTSQHKRAWRLLRVTPSTMLRHANCYNQLPSMVLLMKLCPVTG
jgi:hypothetical protein